MGRYDKYDQVNFEYNKNYSIESEYKWDFLADDEQSDKYFKKRSKIFYPNISNVQVKTGVEVVGQIGEFSGDYKEKTE